MFKQNVNSTVLKCNVCFGNRFFLALLAMSVELFISVVSALVFGLKHIFSSTSQERLKQALLQCITDVSHAFVFFFKCHVDTTVDLFTKPSHLRSIDYNLSVCADIRPRCATAQLCGVFPRSWSLVR